MASNNKKKQKNMKASKKGVIITTLVVTVLALAAIAYIIYFTGLLPRVVPGMEVVKTAEDGSTSTIEKISVLEVNYHTRQVMSSYNISYEMWDEVADTVTGKTYGDYVLEIAADEIKNCVVINNAAEAAGYDDHGGARRYAEAMLENATMYAQFSNVTNDQYLAGIYGTGMTTRLFISCTERMALTSEYESFVQQFVNAPSNEQIQATFDENPGAFQKADFSYRLFQIGENDGQYATVEDAQAAADKVIATLDSSDELTAEVFADAVIDVVGEDSPELQGLQEGTTPYYYQNYANSMGYISVDVNDYVFAAENEAGAYTTIATENGVYVILVIDKYVDETSTYAYRVCSMYLVNNGGDFQAAVDAGNAFVANPTDALGFDQFVKENTVYPNEILTGGYYEGITEENFATSEADIDIAMFNWISDPARKEGDMTVLTSADQSTVRVVYFERCTPRWMQTCRTQARAALSQQWRSELFTENITYVISAEMIQKLTYGNR
ncbi:MAG: hypothetical protein MJ093_02535 [Saccharofermentans sp.]|nr:hypothetical protein [Saccharofermentans sp.]